MDALNGGLQAAAAPSREGQGVHLSDDAGRREPDGHVRSQAGAREVRQHGDGLEQREDHRSGEPLRQTAADSKKSVEVQKYGQCGMDVSELFPHLATCVDDMAFVRSVQTENGNHPAAAFLMNTGLVMPGRLQSAHGSHMGLARKTRIFPASSFCPITARCRSAARSNGERGSCRPVIRAR